MNIEKVDINSLIMNPNNPKDYHKSHKQKDSSDNKVTPYDYSFTRWGNILKPAKPYQSAGVITIKCNNPNNKNEIIEYLKWLYHYEKETGILSSKSISVASLTKRNIQELLILGIKDIK